MPKQPNAPWYCPYKGKKKPHLERRMRKRSDPIRPPPEPCKSPQLVLGQRVSTPAARSADEALGPLMGTSHTRRILDGIA
jgi:hypothetical protein